MYALRKDTLAGLKQSSLFEPRRIEVNVPVTVARLNKFMDGTNASTQPEAEAVKFYFANHTFSLIGQRYAPHEPLPDEVYPLARGYVKLASDLTVRLIYYTLMIVTREARHFNEDASVMTSIRKECGPEMVSFLRKILPLDEDLAVNALRTMPPDVTLDVYLRGMEKVFYEGHWGHSYGGPKWGNIATTLRKLVLGEISAEMFADTGFTLAHNGGPMFNKGMLYRFDYPHALKKILDVQRSGQIPQMTPTEIPNGVTLDNETKDYVLRAKKIFPADLGGYVDWYKVEALGALGSYPADKKNQVAKYGPSKFQSEIEKEQEAKEAAEAAAAAKAAQEALALEAKKFKVGPEEEDYAMIVERQAA